MAEPSPDDTTDADRAQRQPVPAGRPRWVTAVIVAAVLLLAVVVVLHLSGNGLGGPGSHVP